jgi:ubiquinol-cytochrome c reductase cytochrome c1 subunit
MILQTNIRAMKKTLVLIAATVGLTLAAQPALAAGGESKPLRSGGFSFEGPFGSFDRNQLQRGYKVYREVCASCHGMELMHFRTLAEPGGPFYDSHQVSPAENRWVKALAKEIQIADIDTETGEPVMREGTAADRFPNPYPNATAGAAANGGAAPPDLSVMAKARKGGADYIYSLLTGYAAVPQGLQIRPGQYYNEYMPGDLTPFMPDGAHVPPGGFIAMPNPLNEGTVASVDQMAKDVSAYIAWASDPRAIQRKQAGVGVLIFLFIFAGITYMSYRRIWNGIAH